MTNAVSLAQQASTGVSQGFKNRIINGAMVIDQRNAGAAVTINSGANFYTVDRWFGTGVASAGVFTLTQSTSTPPTGFTNFLRTTVTTADSSLAAADFYAFCQRIEGFNIADLGWGTANAKTVTLSFWVRSSLTGTFTGSLAGTTAASAAYVYSYTINAANTWEQKTITITGPTIGTFSSTNGVGIQIWFGLGYGSNYVGSANVWTASAIYGVSGATNVMATNGATFDITGVQLEVGSTATSFEVRDYGTELGLCQRYFYLHASGSNVEIGTGYQYNANTGSVSVHLKVPMRTTPTLYSSSGANYFITYGNSAGSYSTAVTLNAASSNTAALLNVTNGLTAGSGIDMRCDAAGAYVGFSAEL